MNNVEEMRACCLSFPYVNEKVQWEDHLLFRVADKMFAVYSLNPASTNILTFKCSPEDFAELTEKEGIIPAPYMARNNWVALQQGHPLTKKQLAGYLRESYEMVYAKLPRKVKVELEGGVGEGSKKATSQKVKATSQKTKPTSQKGKA